MQRVDICYAYNYTKDALGINGKEAYPFATSRQILAN